MRERQPPLRRVIRGWKRPSPRSVRAGRSQAQLRTRTHLAGTALFDALLADLREYSQAENSAARLAPLNRIYQVSNALAVVPWAPAASLREELRQWLRPRVRLAWAERRLDETVRSLPPTQ